MEPRNAVDHADPSGYNAIIKNVGGTFEVSLLVSFIGGTAAERQLVKNEIAKQWTSDEFHIKTTVTEVPSDIAMNTIAIGDGKTTNVLPIGPNGSMNFMNIGLGQSGKDVIYGIRHESGHLLGIIDHYDRVDDEAGNMVASTVWGGFDQDVMGASGKFGITTMDIWEIYASDQNIHIPADN